MNRLDEILERVIDGGMYLVLWGAVLAIAAIVFAFTTIIGAIIFESVFAGVVVGLVVVFGAGSLLYAVGKRF